MDRNLSYYPGCSLHGTAEEYDASTREICALLGVGLHELDDWNCCGASSAHVLSKEASVLMPARNLALAGREGKDLLVPCAACYGRSKAAQAALEEDASLRDKFGETFAEDPPAKVSIVSLLDVLAEPAMLHRIQEQVKKPLAGLKTVCYYGCLLVRPPRVTGAANYEAPESMDHVLTAVGATPLPWSYKTDCCGGGLAIGRSDLVAKLVDDLLMQAIDAGAEALVTACPMCQGNLDTRQQEARQAFERDYELPIFYISELVGLALGHPGVDAWWRKHLLDPRPLLRARELM